jgi:hypothetical protein
MRKLRTVLAAALLTIPVMTLNASASSADASTYGVSSTQSLTGTCWVYMGGRWWAFPC